MHLVMHPRQRAQHFHWHVPAPSGRVMLLGRQRRADSSLSGMPR